MYIYMGYIYKGYGIYMYICLYGLYKGFPLKGVLHTYIYILGIYVCRAPVCTYM